jgi:hypothetical protein
MNVRRSSFLCGRTTNAMSTIDITDETVKVCAFNFSKGAFLQAAQAIIELTLFDCLISNSDRRPYDNEQRSHRDAVRPAVWF